MIETIHLYWQGAGAVLIVCLVAALLYKTFVNLDDDDTLFR